jgi:hypothetical protein
VRQELSKPTFTKNVNRQNICVGFEVFTAVVLKSIFFWDMTPCSALSEDGGDTFLRNVGYHSTHYMASYPRRRHSSDKTSVGTEVLTAVTMLNATFWAVTQCYSVKVHRRFGRNVSPDFSGRHSSTLQMEAIHRRVPNHKSDTTQRTVHQ